MVYTTYPEKRNYKKRCEIHSLRLALEKEMNAELDRADMIEDGDAWEIEFNRIHNKYDYQIKNLIDMEYFLLFPETKNKWFCEIVQRFGEGEHRISKRQEYCFSQYFESDEYTWKSHKIHCRVDGFFCSIYSLSGISYLIIKKI